MSRPMVGSMSLVVWSLLFAWTITESVDGMQQESKDAWPEKVASKLDLAPAVSAPDKELLIALTKADWVAAGPVNILGDGSVETLHFASNSHGGLSLETTITRQKGFGHGAGGNPAGRTQSEPCEIVGPVLWRPGQPSSFVVVKGHRLILNALAPVGERRWYYVAGERDSAGKSLLREEYLFEFADDPLKHDMGKGNMRVKVGVFAAKTEEFEFSLTRADKDLRVVQIDVRGPNGVSHRARISFSVDGLYGLMTDNSNVNSRIFTASPEEPPTNPEAPPVYDHQKAAEQTDWHWNPEDTNPLHLLSQQGDTYDIELLSNHAERSTIQFRVCRDGKTVYRWDGHKNSVFRIFNDRLYYVRFGGGPGGTVVAVDLTKGEELWSSPLQGIPVKLAYGKYRTLFNLAVSASGVFVYGCEPAGRYFEDKDPATGKTVGHKIFSPTRNAGSDGCE